MTARPTAMPTAALLLLALVGCATAGTVRPSAGVRTVGGDPGYSVAYVGATPKPRSILAPGQTVAFNVTVEYRLESAQRGTLGLVIQDETGRSLTPERKQVSQQVERGAGRITFSDTVIVPPGVRGVQLFIPLFPELMNSSTGELVILYRVR